MSELTTHVGIDAHKAELHVAMLAPDATSPVSLDGAERGARGGATAPEAGTGRAGVRVVLLRSGPVRLRVAATARTGAGSAAR